MSTPKPQRLRDPVRGLAFAASLSGLQRVAREHGYALAVHGSMATDLDLVAAPWIEDAADAETLIEALREAVNGIILPDGTPGGRWDPDQGRFVVVRIWNPERKPHGRKAWSIHVGESGSLYLDVSVMPRRRRRKKLLPETGSNLATK